LYFRDQFGERLRHIDIFTPDEIRRERARHSGRQADFGRADHHAVESGVEAVASLADVTIINDSDIVSLEQNVYKALEGGIVNAG
jgi:dephospho-CoA kinase